MGHKQASFEAINVWNVHHAHHPWPCHACDRRFARETAFQQQQQEAAGSSGAADGSGEAPRPSSKLFMSPADLQALVVAADRLGRDAQGSSTGILGTAQDTQAARAAAARNYAGDAGAEASHVELGTGSSVAALGDGEVSASSVHSLAARFAELLSRWDTSAAASAAELPAGVAARASVSKAAAGLRAAAAAAVAGAAEPAPDASAEHGTYESPAQFSPPRGSQGVGGHQEDAAVRNAADATAALLLDLQQPVSELSAPDESAPDESAPDDSAPDSEGRQYFDAAAVAPQDASAAEGVAEAEVSAVSLPAEAHFEGMQEASQMLQQALSRHDALMQLIAGLGGPPGSVSDVLASSTASGSELTL